jgi:hypothetical protein
MISSFVFLQLAQKFRFEKTGRNSSRRHLVQSISKILKKLQSSSYSEKKIVLLDSLKPAYDKNSVCSRFPILFYLRAEGRSVKKGQQA